VLTSRQLRKVRDSVKFCSGDLAELVSARLRLTYRNVWFVGGGAVSGECLRLGSADESRYGVHK
jgi:dihydrofolate reductase